MDNIIIKSVYSRQYKKVTRQTGFYNGSADTELRTVESSRESGLDSILDPGLDLLESGLVEGGLIAEGGLMAEGGRAHRPSVSAADDLLRAEGKRLWG